MPHAKDQINSDLVQLEKAWISEKSCPQLLPFQTEAVKKIISAINDQVRRLIKC